MTIAGVMGLNEDLTDFFTRLKAGTAWTYLWSDDVSYACKVCLVILKDNVAFQRVMYLWGKASFYASLYI